MVAIKLNTLISGCDFVRASNNANTTWTLGSWIPKTTGQNLIKLMFHLYHEVQSTVSILGHNMFSLKILLSSKTKPGSEQNTTNFKPFVLIHPYLLLCLNYHIFPRTWWFSWFSKTLENVKFCVCDKTASESNFLMFYIGVQFVSSCRTHL